MKIRLFLTAKTIDMYDYIKTTHRDFTPEIFVLHVGQIPPFKKITERNFTRYSNSGGIDENRK